MKNLLFSVLFFATTLSLSAQKINGVDISEHEGILRLMVVEDLADENKKAEFRFDFSAGLKIPFQPVAELESAKGKKIIITNVADMLNFLEEEFVFTFLNVTTTHRDNKAIHFYIFKN
jgi:hypothetical protein